MLFLTGCASNRAGKEFGKAKVDGLITACSGRINCPLPEEKKQGIIAKLRESGEADEIVKAIENGEIRMYEMNDTVREKYESYKGIGKGVVALRDGNNIYIDPDSPNAVAAASTAHEGTHIFDKGPDLTDADTLHREIRAHNKQVDVWEALKKRDPSLEDPHNDATVQLQKHGFLDDYIIKEYELYELKVDE